MPQYIGTDTPLTGDAIYTSNGVATDRYMNFIGTAYSDHAGVLHIEQGPDNVHWDGDTSVTVAAATPTEFNVAVVAPYLRVRYVNGATAQTAFRLSPSFTNYSTSA